MIGNTDSRKLLFSGSTLSTRSLFVGHGTLPRDLSVEGFFYLWLVDETDPYPCLCDGRLVSLAPRTGKEIYLIDFPDEVGPALL